MAFLCYLVLNLLENAYPSEHEALSRCCCIVGTASKTLAQHYNNIGATPHVCRDAYGHVHIYFLKDYIFSTIRIIVTLLPKNHYNNMKQRKILKVLFHDDIMTLFLQINLEREHSVSYLQDTILSYGKRLKVSWYLSQAKTEKCRGTIDLSACWAVWANSLKKR